MWYLATNRTESSILLCGGEKQSTLVNQILTLELKDYNLRCEEFRGHTSCTLIVIDFNVIEDLDLLTSSLERVQLNKTNYVTNNRRKPLCSETFAFSNMSNILLPVNERRQSSLNPISL